MVNETRKIMGLPSFPSRATCVRVPVFFCHSESVHLYFGQPLSPEKAEEILCKAPGVKLVDDLKDHVYPDAAPGGGRRRHAGGPHPPRPRRPERALALLVRLGQPAQGRGDQRRADRRSPPRDARTSPESTRNCTTEALKRGRLNAEVLGLRAARAAAGGGSEQRGPHHRSLRQRPHPRLFLGVRTPPLRALRGCFS